VTLLFLDYTGTAHAYIVWCARIQFFPALVAINAAVVLGLVLMTLLLGRVYCSVICPLGIFQDMISRLTGIGRENRYSYRPPRRQFVIARCSLSAIFVAAVALHIPVVSAALEPYSVYGRMISQIFGPLYQWGNNILAHFAERADSYAFYTVDIWLRDMSALVVAVFTFVVTSVFAWKSGRGYCNGICPVGALFGLLSKYSLMNPRIARELCLDCGACAENCKAGCIDPKRKEIDYSRCVACFNCLERCPNGALNYATSSYMKMPPVCRDGNPPPDDPKEPSDTEETETHPATDDTKELSDDSRVRRSLLTGGIAAIFLGFAGSAAGRTYDFDGGLAPLKDKEAPARSHPIIPPGADNIRNLRRRCTGCQLCVTTCPSHVLRPSGSVSGFMQPHMSFERGYCRPECVKCSNVCPTGAIRPITTEEKSATQIGIAVLALELCVVNRDNVSCDLCERACPTKAIKRIPKSADDSSSPKIPMIETNRCNGCGACEYLCPSRPYSAIYVNGVDTHRTI